jgi:rare lipoprotein A
LFIDLKKTLTCAMIITGTCLGAQSVNAASASVQRGHASWYGPGFQGRLTANGERFNTHALTAAHKTLPFGTRVRVVNQKTGRSVVVRINDRGPFVRGRIIDLAHSAAQRIGLSGVAAVALFRLS